MILDNQFLTDKNGNVNLLTTYFDKDGELKMNRFVFATSSSIQLETCI